MSRVNKLSEDDQEDDKAWNPGISLVCMDDLVSEACNNECAGCNENDSSPTWHVMVDSVKELCSNDHIYSGPPNTSQDIEYSNFWRSVTNY